MSGGDMPCAGCGAPIVGTPDELCFHCEGEELAAERQAELDAPLYLTCTCGQPAAPSAGLCDRCRENYEASLDSDRRWWTGGGL